MRKNISAYTKNMPEASKFRDELNHITNADELIDKVKKFFMENKN